MATKDPREPFTRIDVKEAQEMTSKNSVALIDVREPHEYKAGHVPGAKLIPVATVFARRDELPRDKDVVFVCAVGQRSALACEMAAAAGLTRLFNLEGGVDDGVLSLDEFAVLLDRYERGAGYPTTAAPAPGRFLEAFRQCLQRGYSRILAITISSRLSKTYESALQAADLFRQQHPE